MSKRCEPVVSIPGRTSWCEPVISKLCDPVESRPIAPMAAAAPSCAAGATGCIGYMGRPAGRTGHHAGSGAGRLQGNPLAGPGLVLLELPWEAGRHRAGGRGRKSGGRSGGPCGRTAPRPHRGGPAGRAGDKVLAAGEEDPLDAALGLLHAGAGLRAGDDDDVPRGHADDELARHRALEAGPEIGGEQQARFETLERQHQRRAAGRGTRPATRAPRGARRAERRRTRARAVVAGPGQRV